MSIPFSVPRTNVDTARTVVSTLRLAHEGGEEGILPFLS